MNRNVNIGESYFYDGDSVILEKFVDFKKSIVRKKKSGELEIVELKSLAIGNSETTEESSVYVDALSDKD